MDNFDNVTLVASAPGRLRIGIPRLYRSQPVADRLESELTRHPSVLAAHANILTARVLLLFDPQVDADALLAELALEIVDEQRSAPGNEQHSATTGTLTVTGPAGDSAGAPMYAPWHLRSADEALAYHASSLELGLTQDEAEQRLQFGLNTVSRPQPPSALEILLNQFKSLPVGVLAVSAGVSLMTGAWAEAGAICAALALNGTIGFRTEQQAAATMASLSELIDDEVFVRRDGEMRRIASANVVPGDVLALAPGTRIAADLRLLQARELMIDESALTGESFPVAKSIEAQSVPTPLAERTNMAYRGTAVAMGTGLGLVVGTGSRTEAGAIEALTNTVERPMTQTQRQLDELGTQLVKVSAAMCLGIFGLGLLRGHDRVRMFRTAVALAIAAVPEGLPAVATSSLARGIRRMREQDVLIRHLHAVDTIGAIQTICLDKTGTLTMNQMSVTAVQTVRHALYPERPAAGGGGDTSAELSRLLQVCVLCNESRPNGGGRYSAEQGSGTENALLELAERAGIEVARVRQQYPLLSTELRAQGRNYMRTVHAIPDSGQRLVAVKGSPEQVLALCGSFLDGGEVCLLDEPAMQRILQQNQEMAARQLRILGTAFAEQPELAPDVEAVPALTWVGLVGLADPLRPGVARAIERFHEAGIRTVMLTGDQAATAYEIGRALHLNEDGELAIVNVDELEQSDPAQLAAQAAKANIFSRVTPSDKLRIVQALQASGATIAMTGDGINDSPALRAADIGIAMGSGTDVALSVADVALKHDGLESVLDAIAHSRTIGVNSRKSVHFLVSSNLSEILVVFGGVAIGNGMQLSPIQLLWLNLLTDMLPAIALAAEAAEEDVMQRPPREPKEHLIQKKDLLRYGREAGVLAAGSLSAYAIGALRHGAGARAATIGFDALVLGQLLHALYCRSESRSSLDRGAPPNRSLTLALLGSAGLQGLAHLVPALRRLLGITPLGPLDLLTIAAGAGVPLLVNELTRPAPQSKAASSASAERSNSFSTTVPTTLSATLSAHAGRVSASA